MGRVWLLAIAAWFLLAAVTFNLPTAIAVALLLIVVRHLLEVVMPHRRTQRYWRIAWPKWDPR